MKRLILAPLICLIFAGFAFADDAVNHGADDYSVPAYKIGRIAKITITAASEKDNSDPKENCQPFSVTPKLSTFFFSHSKIVSQASAFHDFTYSSCYAEGTIEFSNGDMGEWRITHGGTGTLLLKAGKSKDKFLHLYCKRCDDQDM